MRVDTDIQDHELLDWDKPLSEQSELVRNALKDAGKPEWVRRSDGLVYGDFLISKVGNSLSGVSYRLYLKYDNAGQYKTLDAAKAAAERMTGEPNSGTGKQAYDALVRKLGSKQAASEYLDSIGIKGIKFLDADSRDATKDWASYPAWDELADSAKADDYLGYDSRNQMISALLQDGVAASAANYDMSPELRKYMEGLEQWLKEPVEQTRNIVVFNDKNIQRIFTEKGANPESRLFSFRSEEHTSELPVTDQSRMPSSA